MTASEHTVRRGSPLALLVILLAAWVGGRAMTWQNPFPAVGDIPGFDLILADTSETNSSLGKEMPLGMDARQLIETGQAGLRQAQRSSEGSNLPTFTVLSAAYSSDAEMKKAFGHQSLWLQALGAKLPFDEAPVHASDVPMRLAGVTPISPPIEEALKPGRWSFDAWGFWKQGSASAAVSQGRIPIYGASQIGANLQYRIAPNSLHDPRLYARAYRAIVTNGETELAIGGSVRPVGAIPIRVAGEWRVTESRGSTNMRPAVVAITELPPQKLPAGFKLEAFGGAGYVGGAGATPFVDGQAAVTREMAEFEGPSDTRARLSIGAGAWGGAQEDASRIDVGPTVRLDLTLGKVPARLSVDWRERVGGDASPNSGVAATLSTRF